MRSDMLARMEFEAEGSAKVPHPSIQDRASAGLTRETE
jgi:hypothetical protein